MCAECDETKNRRGHWHAYQVGCVGCIARAVARSLAAFRAVRHREPHELREMIERLFPSMSYEAARAMVWDAWRIDHEEGEVIHEDVQTQT